MPQPTTEAICNRTNARRRGIYSPVKRKKGSDVDKHEASIYSIHLSPSRIQYLSSAVGPRRHWEHIVYVCKLGVATSEMNITSHQTTRGLRLGLCTMQWRQPLDLISRFLIAFETSSQRALQYARLRMRSEGIDGCGYAGSLRYGMREDINRT